MIKKLCKFIANIITLPFRAIKKIFTKKEHKKVNKKIELIKQYLDIAKNENLKINIQSKYDDELVITLANDVKLKQARTPKKENKVNDN